MYGISKENNDKKTAVLASTFYVEVESDVLDFDSEKLKVLLIEAVKNSKFFSIEIRTNGKFSIIAEIDVLKNIDTGAE